MDELKAQIGARSLPEQLFVNSGLRLTHEASGTVLDFGALSSLRQWHAAALPPVQVSTAASWRAAREADMKAHNAVTLEYDWTYTTSYMGDVRSTSHPQDGSLEGQPPVTDGGTPSGAASPPGAPSPAAHGPAPPASESQWRRSEQQMDRTALMARDPILFYDEVPLYESELDDNGSSQLSVKVRMMPACWLVLLRFWLRVDGVLLRLRETRYYCDLTDPNTVLREVKHSEGTFAELQAHGAPAEGAAYADADSAVTALSAVAPVGVKLFELSTLALVGEKDLLG